MSMPRARGPGAGRIAAAVPDAISAVLCLLAWWFPLLLGAAWVKNLVASLALEFATVHSSGVIGTTLADPRATRARKVSVLLRFGAFYLALVAAFCWGFGGWWPVAAFAWLLAAKLFVIWLEPLPTAEERSRQATFTLASVAMFLVAAPVLSMLPVPEFGIDAGVRAAAGLPPGTDWDAVPHRAAAFGVLYFGVLAWTKARWRPGSGVKLGR